MLALVQPSASRARPNTFQPVSRVISSGSKMFVGVPYLLVKSAKMANLDSLFKLEGTWYFWIGDMRTLPEAVVVAADGDDEDKAAQKVSMSTMGPFTAKAANLP